MSRGWRWRETGGDAPNWPTEVAPPMMKMGLPAYWAALHSSHGAGRSSVFEVGSWFQSPVRAVPSASGIDAASSNEILSGIYRWLRVGRVSLCASSGQKRAHLGCYLGGTNTELLEGAMFIIEFSLKEPKSRKNSYQ